MLPRQHVEFDRGHSLAEELRVLAKAHTGFFRMLEQVKYLERSTHNRRSNRVREQIRTRPLPQQVHNLSPRAGVTPAGSAQRLAERSRDDVNTPHHAVVLVGATAVVAHESDRVGLI